MALSLAAAAALLANDAGAHELAAGGGLPALAVTSSGTGLLAVSCAQGPCARPAAAVSPTDPAGSPPLPLELPERFHKGLPQATFESLPVGKGRSVIVVTVVDPAEGDRWVTVVAATKDGPKMLLHESAAPSLDRLAREPKMLQPRAGTAGTQLLLGDRSETVHLCGRPTLLAPRVLDPTDLVWKGVKVQQLGETARSTAATLSLQKSDEPPPFARLLSAVGASSALRAGPLAATDGDKATFWSEARGGDGHGEFLVLRVPREVPLSRLLLTPLPTGASDEGLVAPKRAFLVADERVFRLEIPANVAPGTVFSARFPEPLKTSCLALVLDEGARDDKTSAVTVAEIAVGTRFDDAVVDPEALVGSLAGGGEDARAAAAILAGAGEKVLPVIERRYASLDDAGRVLALGVLDQLPCEQTAATYVRALSSKYEAESAHGAARLARCGRKAARPLLLIAADVKDPARFRAAEELSVLAPDLLLPLLAKRTGDESPAVRKVLRSALTRAVRAPRAEAALAVLLADETLPPARTFELLRAGGALAKPDLAGPAEAALDRVAPETAPFESRWLAVVPAGILAMSGREKSLARLTGALADPDLRVRVEAVRAIGSLPSQREKVLGLVRDPEPRVRQALASALRVLDDRPARDALVTLLDDEWTFVRSAALESLATASPDARVDAALLGLLGKERVPAAQIRLVEAVASRRLFVAGPGLLALSSGSRVPLDVRVRATVALGRVCHTPSRPKLVALANAGLAPYAERDDATLGHAALAALARLEAGDARAMAELSPEARKALPDVVAVLEPGDRCGSPGKSASLGGAAVF